MSYWLISVRMHARSQPARALPMVHVTATPTNASTTPHETDPCPRRQVPSGGSLGQPGAIVNQLKGSLPSDVVVEKMTVPELKVGTLDSLMALSDDLDRVDRYVEGVVHRLEKEIKSLIMSGADPDRDTAAQREAREKQCRTMPFIGAQQPAEDFLRKFNWDQARYGAACLRACACACESALWMYGLCVHVYCVLHLCMDACMYTYLSTYAYIHTYTHTQREREIHLCRNMYMYIPHRYGVKSTLSELVRDIQVHEIYDDIDR